jgi:L-ribulose-5-phosphate 3-epimerase
MNNTLPMNRRGFLRHSLAAAGAVALAPGFLSAAEAPAGKRNYRKAIMWETVGVKGTVLEKCQAIKEAGFAGLEPSSHMNQEEVLKALEATGLQAASVCCSTHWSKPVSDPNPAVREAGVEGLKQALRDAKRYGASSVLFVPGVVNKQVSYADAYTRSQEAIRRVVPLAEELAVRIAIENVWNSFLLSPLEAARFVDEFNSPMVGWHFDCGNIVNYGWPEQWIRILGKRISRIHVKEFSRKKADKEGRGAGFNVALLEGDDDWPAIMKALDEVGYSGWMISEQGGAGSLEGMKDLATRMDRIVAS